MITCDFNGRLGNNLFQIANVISAAKKTNENFIFPETTWAGHRGVRPVDLSMFDYEFPRGVIQCRNSYSEKDFHYEEVVAEPDTKYSGFYQSWKYFEDVKTDLLKTYFIPNKEILSKLDSVHVSDNSLGISVRRGDYLMLQENHCTLGPDYYQNAIDKYFRDVDQVFIFSDDIGFCKMVFGNDANYVDGEIGFQLFLMTRMKNLIISNSTFAWWGAYLNQMDGIIVAPNPWFGPNYKDKNTNDLYLPNWKIQIHKPSLEPYHITENMYN